MVYIPKSDPVVDTLDEFKEYVADEFLAVSQGFTDPFDIVWLKPLGQKPPRPREGMLAFSQAGVLGASAGLYCFKGGAWVLV